MEQQRPTCKFCASENVELIIDFGKVALAGAFLLPEHFKDEKKYPQQLYFCQDCFLLYIINRVDPKVLFNDYFYFSSAIETLRNHFKSYAQEVTKRFLVPENASVLEIGCNDGILVKPFAELKVKRVIGVDPSTNVISTINDPNIITINDFFSTSLANKIEAKYGKMDLIVANNVFAHIDNMFDIANGIHSLLADDGVFAFEVHYIGSLIKEIQYDMIYHEHIYYYSLLALENFFSRFDLEVFDVKAIPIHAGSMRYYVRKKGGLNKFPLSENVSKLREQEIKEGYNKVSTFLDYAKRVENTKINLMELLSQIKNNEKARIVGYGASGRANTLIQYCGINSNHIEYMIDDAPTKQGYYTPGSHLPIKARDILKQDNPDYILVFAWSFFNEIVSKNIEFLKKGGKMIVPLPDVKVISMENGTVIQKEFVAGN